MGPRRLFWILAFFAILFASVQLRAQEIVPNPSLSPEQVVQFQVDALRQNDEPRPGIGIERSFRFASPSNKEATGPLAHFAEIVRSPAYAPLLHSSTATVAGSQINGSQAHILVKVIPGHGTAVSYVFLLSRQPDGEYRDCWMTDGVIRVGQEEPGSEPVAI